VAQPSPNPPNPITSVTNLHPHQVGTKRFDSELSGDREVQRTMLELLNQLDGFTQDDNIKARPPALEPRLCPPPPPPVSPPSVGVRPTTSHPLGR
jgi:hypothetical protein